MQLEPLHKNFYVMYIYFYIIVGQQVTNKMWKIPVTVMSLMSGIIEIWDK